MQTSVALSTAKAEYISAGLGCAQILWMQDTLKEYGVNFKKTQLGWDNATAIAIPMNVIVKYHFIKEHVQDGNIDNQNVPPET